MRIFPFIVSTSLKFESVRHEDGSFPMSTLLKMKQGSMRIVSFTVSTSLKDESIHYDDTYFTV